MPGVLVDTQPSSSSSPLAFGTVCSPSFSSAHPHPSSSSSLPSLSSSSPSPAPSSPSPSSPFLTISPAPQPPCEAPLPPPLLHFQQQLQQTPMELPSFSPPPSPSHLARELSQKLVPRTGLSRLSSSHGFVADTVDDNGASAPFDLPEYPDLNGLPIPFNNGYAPPNSNNSTIVGSPSSAMAGSPIFSDAITALQKFLPSNNDDEEKWPVDSWPAMDTFSCDDFRMYEFKVRRCMRGRSHDWTECPFAHPGEKARRRDPRRFHYSGTACPDFRKGSCKRGDACEYAHGVFECWLHPARYRTQPCKDGKDCKRRVCFFAHTVEQLRVLPSSATLGSGNSLNPSPKVPCYDGSPLRQALAGGFALEGYGGSLSDNGSLDGYGFSKLLDEGAHMTSSPRVQSLSGKKVKTGYGGVTGYGVASSPTSTLVGQSNSPPPLSPPLSPSISPPMSPVSPNGWHRSHSLHSHTHSPLSNASVPAHRQHLNRLRSVPTISIPSLEEEDQFAHNSPVSPSPQAIGELLASLHSLQLRARVGEDGNRGIGGLQSPQPWNHQPGPLTSACYSRSFPGSPAARGKSNWEGSEAWAGMETGLEVPAHRVESGRDLRAKIYGKIGKDNGVSNDSPDLGWVNELVK